MKKKGEREKGVCEMCDGVILSFNAMVYLAIYWILNHCGVLVDSRPHAGDDGSEGLRRSE